MKTHTTIPTHLFVGEGNLLHDTIMQQLQYAFCKHQIPPNSGCFCNECRKIKNKQHPFIVWIEPEKSYLISDISIIFEKIRFTLEPEQTFFFVLKKTHTLTRTCANKLLKTLEEPPPGYRFLLITNNELAVLPTIRSRSHIHYVHTESSNFFTHPLLDFFIDPKKQLDPFNFEQELRNRKPTEPESIELLNQLIKVIQKKLILLYKPCAHKEALELLQHNKQYNYLQEMLVFLHKQQKQPPQPGSAALFWKQLFLTWPKNEKFA